VLYHIAVVGYVMMQLDRGYTEGAYGEGFAGTDFGACAIGELLLLDNVLVAVDVYSELGILCGILGMVALSRGSAIYTLPRHLVI
jgi:hypothetical protein